MDSERHMTRFYSTANWQAILDRGQPTRGASRA
jgi:hypothetical protein